MRGALVSEEAAGPVEVELQVPWGIVEVYRNVVVVGGVGGGAGWIVGWIVGWVAVGGGTVLVL